MIKTSRTRHNGLVGGLFNVIPVTGNVTSFPSQSSCRGYDS